jgi:AraC-like DNA-binding protein
MDSELREMTMEIPAPSLSGADGIETGHFAADNRYVEVALRETRTPNFSVVDLRICCRDDLRMFSAPEESDMVWFCAVLQGNILCSNHTVQGEERWQKGEANLLVYGNQPGYICFNREKPFHMIEIMLPPAYLERMAALYPDLFGEICEQHVRRRFTRAFPKHIPYCPGIAKAIRDLQNYQALGHAAPLYLDAKLSEILSLFLCRLKQKDCAFCHCCKPKDRDRLLHARTIVESEYLNPPSLHKLAQRVGTNECTLKNGFKRLFGATVFGYLFDYRMEKACLYLQNTDKTVQEIAELVGYDYHSHFTTAFKRKFCLSPQEYRNIQRSK